MDLCTYTVAVANTKQQQSGGKQAAAVWKTQDAPGSSGAIQALKFAWAAQQAGPGGWGSPDAARQPSSWSYAHDCWLNTGC